VQHGLPGSRWKAKFGDEIGTVHDKGIYVDNEIIAERRPITDPVWDGVGLPPAGVECEAKYRSGSSEWSPFKCVAPDKELAFGWSGDEPVILLEDLYEFRPIRSAEDVARDKAVSSMCDHWNLRTDLMCQSIYDAIAAGKIPGVKLE
jgi:hypothetical protein